MNRRQFCLSAVGAIGVAGCIETDSQPDSVPIWVENQATQQQDVVVECRQAGGGETLVSADLALGPGAEESVYADPIRADATYSVVIELAEHRKTAVLSGGELRSIEVTIHEKDSVRVSRTDT